MDPKLDYALLHIMHNEDALSSVFPQRGLYICNFVNGIRRPEYIKDTWTGNKTTKHFGRFNFEKNSFTLIRGTNTEKKKTEPARSTYEVPCSSCKYYI